MTLQRSTDRFTNEQLVAILTDPKMQYHARALYENMRQTKV